MVSTIETSVSGSSASEKAMFVLNDFQDFKFELPENLRTPGKFLVAVGTEDSSLMGNYYCEFVSSSGEVMSSSNNGYIFTDVAPLELGLRLYPSNIDPTSRSHAGKITEIRITRFER